MWTVKVSGSSAISRQGCGKIHSPEQTRHDTRTASAIILMLGASLLLASCTANPTGSGQARRAVSQQVKDAAADSVDRNNIGAMGSGN